MEKWSERNWFGKVKYIWGCVIIAFLGGVVIVNIVEFCEEYVQPRLEEYESCAEWRESFPDRRLIEMGIIYQSNIYLRHLYIRLR